jgi:hypothetical protein
MRDGDFRTEDITENMDGVEWSFEHNEALRALLLGITPAAAGNGS